MPWDKMPVLMKALKVFSLRSFLMNDQGYAKKNKCWEMGYWGREEKHVRNMVLRAKMPGKSLVEV